MLAVARRVLELHLSCTEPVHELVPPDEFEVPRLSIKSVEPSAQDASLLIVYRSGGRYCCLLPGCAYPNAFGPPGHWKKLRARFRASGISPPYPMRFEVRVEFEAGVQWACEPGSGSENTTYQSSDEARWDLYDVIEGRKPPCLTMDSSNGLEDRILALRREGLTEQQAWYRIKPIWLTSVARFRELWRR